MQTTHFFLYIAVIFIRPLPSILQGRGGATLHLYPFLKVQYLFSYVLYNFCFHMFFVRDNSLPPVQGIGGAKFFDAMDASIMMQCES
jgi:hypothetical protein